MDKKQVWLDLYAACIKRGASDKEIALSMGICERTLLRRKKDPGTVTFGEWMNLMNHFKIPLSEIARAK